MLSSVQLMPLQNLNVGFFEIETACQYFGDVPIAAQFAGLVEKFHDTPILAVFDGVFRLCDKVGLIFRAHGKRA